MLRGVYIYLSVRASVKCACVLCASPTSTRECRTCMHRPLQKRRRPALPSDMKTAHMAPRTEYTTQGPFADLTLFIKPFACFISAGRPCRHPQASANLISLFTDQQCPGFHLCLAALRSFISIPGHGLVDHKGHESRRGIHQFFVNL